MFDEIAGLPAHPLLVHAAVVTAPMLALVAVVYASLPVVRERVEVPLAVLAGAAPLSVAGARESGAALQRRLAHGPLPAEALERIDAHAAAGRDLLLLTIGLAALAALWIGWHRSRRAETGMIVLPVALLVLTWALGAGVVWSAIHTGHTGAEMVWASR